MIRKLVFEVGVVRNWEDPKIMTGKASKKIHDEKVKNPFALEFDCKIFCKESANQSNVANPKHVDQEASQKARLGIA